MSTAAWWWTSQERDLPPAIPTGPPVIDPTTPTTVNVAEGEPVDVVIKNVGYYARRWLQADLPPGLTISEYDGLSCRITGVVTSGPPPAYRAQHIQRRQFLLLN